MRIIPKKIKVRNNVWKCYSMKDIFVALVVFALIFVFITIFMLLYFIFKTDKSKEEVIFMIKTK